MATFSLILNDATHSETIPNVVSFIGEDRSGSFGILAGHTRMVTSLVMGLARFRTESSDWQYIAVPGAVLYFHNNLLTLSTRHYLLDYDYMRISTALQQRLVAEEEALQAVKRSLHQMEDQVLKRLWELNRHATR